MGRTLSKGEEEMIRLLIKGDESQVHAAAKKRRIPITDVRRHNECCIADAPQKYTAKVMEWFGEAGNPPFPAGSLLHFSVQEKVEPITETAFGITFRQPSESDRKLLPKSYGENGELWAQVDGRWLVFDKGQDTLYELSDDHVNWKRIWRMVESK